jgi:3-hydroxy-9,10-secoandrosta-1,3,5(10)-triene-9,17-dione monooxygenase
MRDAGVIRMLQPKSYGGFEFHPREFAETVMHLASLDGSAGWVAGVVGVHPWELAYADPRCRRRSGARTPTPGWPRRTRRWGC